MEKQGTGAKQRSYTEEYKRQVVDLVVGTGRTATAVAAEGEHAELWG
jgi:transposase